MWDVYLALVEREPNRDLLMDYDDGLVACTDDAVSSRRRSA